MSKKKKGSADPNEEFVETKKAKKEKKAKKAKKEKTPMDIDSKKTLAKSITALACVIAICVTAVVNTGKMCDAVKKASEQKDDSSISDTSGDDVIDNGDNGEVPTDANGEVPTDANGETPTEADGGEVTTAADSGNSSSGNNSSSTAKTTANSGSSIPTGVAQIVNYYNTATAKVASKKAAFSKTRTTTEKSYESGAALKASKSIVYKFMGVGDENKFSKNITAAEANEYNKYFKASKLTTSDVTSATCTKSGSNYTITLKIKDGSSSVKGGKVVSSNNSPLDEADSPAAITIRITGITRLRRMLCPLSRRFLFAAAQISTRATAALLSRRLLTLQTATSFPSTPSSISSLSFRALWAHRVRRLPRPLLT